MKADALRAFGLGMVVAIALGALMSCSEGAAYKPQSRYVALAVPAVLRKPCEGGPAIPAPPQLPRPVEAIAAYAETLIDTIEEYQRLNGICSRRNARIIRWIDANSVLPGDMPIVEIRK